MPTRRSVGYIGALNNWLQSARHPSRRSGHQVNVGPDLAGFAGLPAACPLSNAKVTGAEAGVCAPISGDTCTSARSQYAAACPAAPALTAQQPACRATTISARVLTGDRPGANWFGDDRRRTRRLRVMRHALRRCGQHATHCATSGRFLQRARPVGTPRCQRTAGVQHARPARASAAVSEEQRDHGQRQQTPGASLVDQQGRRADRRTPEFRKTDLLRYQGQQQALIYTLSRNRRKPPCALHSCLSGEGSARPTRISGDVWLEKSRVTGTEGPSARYYAICRCAVIR